MGGCVFDDVYMLWQEEMFVVEELNGEIGRQYKAEVRKVENVRKLII